jgi:hypothetical protein
MSLPRIPPPPRTTSPPTGDLISLDTPLAHENESHNPHLQLYTGPSADFAQPAAFDTSPPPRQHHHPRIQPPRRLSQVLSSAAPTSPAVVSEDKGNAGFIIPNSPGSSEEFGGFKSAPPKGEAAATTTMGGEGGAGSRPGRQRRMSSLDNLWRGLHLGTGGVGAFPSEEHKSPHADVFHRDDDDASPHPTSPKRPSLDPSQGPGWRHTLSSTLGNTLKAKSKWKTVLGPGTFHPPSPGIPTGYSLHRGNDDSPDLAPTPTAKPISITHASPFAAAVGGTPAATPSSASTLGNPFYNPLSGAPGFSRADTYLGASRPRVGTPVSERGEEQREWKGTRLVGRREGTDVVLDEDAADAVCIRSVWD